MAVTGNEIERGVLEALEADERTRGEAIEVVDQQSVVTLKGSVSSDEARAAAAQIVEDQPGVEEVINDLRVVDEEGVGSDESPFVPPKGKTG